MAKKKKKKQNNDEILQEIRDFKKSVETAESDNRDSYIADTNFEAGNQWDEDSKKDREMNGRPCFVVNKTAGITKQIIGDSRQNDMSIKVRPVDDQSDPGVAQLLTGLIRNIENTSSADVAYDTAGECAIRGGFGYFRINTQFGEDTFDQDIVIERIPNPLSVYFGRALRADNSDAKGCLITETISREDYEAKYPKARKISDFDSHDDAADWFDDDGLTVAEYFKVDTYTKRLILLSSGETLSVGKEKGQISEGQADEYRQAGMVVRERDAECNKVKWYKTNGFEVLDEKDWAGKYIPIITMLGEEVWVDGERELRSAIKWAKEPARLYNWARSNNAETMALAPKQPFLLTPQEIDGHEDQWDVAHRKPMPYLLHNQSTMGRPSRQAPSFQDSGAQAESMLAADDIKAVTGKYDASLGAQSNETSGKAINARKTQGDTATFVFSDNRARALKYAGKVLVDLIPRIYDTERVVRLLNKDGSEAWAKINHIDPVSGETHNDLSIGKYDVTIDIGPAYSTKRLEAADGMIQLAQSAPQYSPIILPRIAKNMDWPEADEIAQEMQHINQSQQGQQDPNAQTDMVKAQVELKKGEQDIQKGELEIASKALDVQQKQSEMESEDVQKVAQVAEQVTLLVLRQVGLLE